jgi:ATP-dependent Clp protease ATP-binding subunit ClpA
MDTVDLPALVTAVGQRAASSPLGRLEAALAMSMDLQASADELVGHFVAEARQAGCSWTEIGEQIGVSKQAARQRFTQERFTQERFTQERFTQQELTRRLSAGPEDLVEQPRLAACREAARLEAKAHGADEVGTDHQLAGLFEEGAAAAILERLGIRADAVRQAASELFPASGKPAAVPPPESQEAREALAGAASLARRAGQGYVGTEHLLAALVLDPGSRARRILIRLDASIPAIKKELECYISPPRQRHRRGKKAEQQCSFCGKSRANGVELVAGPGVWICGPCIDLAAEIVAEGSAGPGLGHAVQR